jgi:putative hemolysin
VVNEYGGFEGLITLHDIMENIVGQIPDEGEPEEPMLFEERKIGASEGMPNRDAHRYH